MKTYEITVWLEVQIFFFFKLIIPEIQHLIVGENRQTQWPNEMYYRGII